MRQPQNILLKTTGELDKRNYQPRRLGGPEKIEIGLPKSAWTPHRDCSLHKIYPIPEDEGEGRSSEENTRRAPRSQENTHTRERTSGPERELNPPPAESQGAGGSAGAPGGGGGGDGPSDPSGDEGPNPGDDEDSEEENNNLCQTERPEGKI